MTYIHTDIIIKQSSKNAGSPCGDVIDWHRDRNATTIVISDGLGSGVKANIAANMCVSRILQLIKSGATLREAFSALVKTMNRAWGTDEPYAVFSVARILNNGDTTILSYEIPPAILIGKNSASVLSNRVFTIEKAIISEAFCQIDINEGLLMVCDGITQAGMGAGLTNGWTIDGVRKFINEKIIYEELKLENVPNLVHDRARVFWRKLKGDDCSVVFAKSRKGVIVNIFTGPPKEKELDKKTVEEFNNLEGIKIVCGGTTAQMTARELNRKMELESDPSNSLLPPKFSIKGIDLVTEGVVTLNQVFNIMDEDITPYGEEESIVFELSDFMQIADRVNFWVGKAPSIGSEYIEFRQQGILPRTKIVPLIVEKLKAAGKLVVVKYV